VCKASEKGQFSVDEVSNKIDVMLVEDNPLLLTLVSTMIKSYPVNLIGAALTYEESLKIFNEKIPNSVVLDLDLGDGFSGFELAIILRGIDPKLAIVFYSSYEDERFMIKNNHNRITKYKYLRKSEIVHERKMYDAILESLELVKSENPSEEQKKVVKYQELNEREIELMKYVASGYSNKKISELYSMKLKSCENAISRLSKKLGIPYEDNSNQRVLITKKYFKYSGKDF
jgi:DNA-binding NarL/FixJ family response regulator